MADERDVLISQYFYEGLTYEEITLVLYERHGIELSVRHLHRILRSLCLSRRMYSETGSVVDFVMNTVEQNGSLHGYRIMRQRCLESGLRVRMQDIHVATILRLCDPDGVEHRTARRFNRRSYFVPGPNFIWHIDGYDKLKPYGLCIHGCICGFSRKVMWLNVYSTNNNPRIIAGYFVEALEKYGGTACIIRGDFGTENVLVKELQLWLRRNTGNGNAYIEGTSTLNQRIECWWGYLRRQHMQHWMNTLHQLQEDGEFSGTAADKSLVQFCFMSIIQAELSLAMSVWNNHTIRRSRNQCVPYGQPNRIHTYPELWNSRDRLCPVPPNDIQFARERAEFRSSVCCDPDVYNRCIDIMAEHGLTPPNTAVDAIHLYRSLRAYIQ